MGLGNGGEEQGRRLGRVFGRKSDGKEDVNTKYAETKTCVQVRRGHWLVGIASIDNTGREGGRRMVKQGSRCKVTVQLTALRYGIG